MNKPVDNFYKEQEPKERLPKAREEKSVEDMLEETAFDVIDLKKEKKTAGIEYDTESIQLEQVDKPKIKTKEEKVEATLENDLFDWIDSMYDDKEDE